VLRKKPISYIGKAFLCLLLCLGGGWVTGLLTQYGIQEWYPNLIKPYATPPNIAFPIVWTLLYVFMATALFLFWISKTTNKKKAFVVFMIQLLLNFSWSWLFFYLQQPGLALFDSILLWFFIFLTIRCFWRHTRYGSYLLIPYLVWVTYALYLNAFIWIFN
jgi:tryptophan-rich sensory protein